MTPRRGTRPAGGERARGRARGRTRGQTTIDFAIGVSLFLLAVAFTLSFVPTMLQPFTDTSQEQTVTVNRVATQLSEGLLVRGDDTYVLDQRCTAAFFDALRSSSGCAFDNTDSIQTIVGVDPETPLNVSVVGADVDGDGTRDLVCESPTGTVAERSTIPCVSTFARGGVPPTGSNSVVVSRRIVTLDGEAWTMVVRIW